MTLFPFSRPPEPHAAPSQLRGPCVWSRIHLEGCPWKGGLSRVDDELLSLSTNSIRSAKFLDLRTHWSIWSFFLRGRKERGEERGDERFLRDIFEFLHLNRIYHVGKYFETLERKIFGQFFEGGRSKYFLIFQLCRMLNGVDNIGKNISDRNCWIEKKFSQ